MLTFFLVKSSFLLIILKMSLPGTRVLLKAFIQVVHEDYLEFPGPNQPPTEREQSFKAKMPDMYYGELHINCYRFYQQCKDHFETVEAPKPIGHLLQLFFFVRIFVYARHSSNIVINIKK